MACGGGGEDHGLAASADAAVDRKAADPRVQADANGGADAIATADASIADVAVDRPQVDAAACNVRLASPPLMTTVHVPQGAVVVYNSNPPSSGPHYATWANFQEYPQPVDDRYLVHSMEHGAVLLLYNCADLSGDAGVTCPELADALRAVRDAVPTDPLCDPSIRVRVILAPRPANDVTVAAAAWGATYRADCVDATSLAQFISAHYAMGPENFCDPGQTSF